MRISIHCFVFLFCLAFIFKGCAPKVAVPPAINLKEHEIVGLINFSCNREGSLGKFTTQKFFEAITEDQKGVRIVELGNSYDVLQSVGQSKMNPDAIKAIGEKYNIKTVIMGDLNVENIQPKIDISTLFSTLKAEAEVEVTIAARMVETTTSVTIWTSSAKKSDIIAEVSIFPNGHFSFDADDPEKAYGKLVEDLVNDLTADFRITYQKKK